MPKNHQHIVEMIAELNSESGRDNHTLLAKVAAHTSELSPPEVARLIESLPKTNRAVVWQQIDVKDKAEVLLDLHKETRRSIIKNTDEEEIIASLSEMQMDELADIDDDLPISILTAMVEAMDAQRRQRYDTVKIYPDDTAGGLMDADATAVRSDVSLKAVLRYMRFLRNKEGSLPEHLDSLVIVDRKNKVLGTLPLSALVSHDTSMTTADVMQTDKPSITPLTPSKEVAQLFIDRELLSAPVVDKEGVLLGRITVDDIVELMRDESEKEILSKAGLDANSDMFSPVIKASMTRAIWLGINLVTAFLAAWVIGLFEASIEQVVALAVLMPVVASMGGVTGTQTLTLVTRGIALGQVGKSNLRPLMWHEIGTAGINGIIWAAVVYAISVLWYGDWVLGLIFGGALLIVILTGTLSGVFIPLILKRMGIDPALAGGVVLTTITDAVGFFVFLGLATAILI
ncbi:magnesium transporter [Aliikangiella sp. IMCC44653]